MKSASLAFALLILSGPILRAGAGGPDAYGYSWIDSFEPNGPDYQWIAPTASVTTVVTGSNQTAGNATLEVPWSLYGNEVTELRASRNGFLTTLSTDPGGDETNDCPIPAIPSQGGGDRIYVLHDNVELDPTTGRITYEYFETSPHPYANCGVHVFTWVDAHHPGPDTSRFSFQALLFDNHDILCQYIKANPELGAGSTTGIQNAGATDGLEVYCNQAVFNAAVAVAIQVRRFTVTNTLDAGGGSLRQALTNAAAENEANVVFDPSIFSTHQTIILATGQPSVSGQTRVFGPAPGVTIDGQDSFRVMAVSGSEGVLLKDLHLKRGAAVTRAGVEVDGSVKMVRCRISDCAASDAGGGLALGGNDNAELISCLLEGNSAVNSGGAIHGFFSGDLILSNTVLKNNLADRGAGMSITFAGSVLMEGSEVRGNENTNTNSADNAVVRITSNTGTTDITIYNTLISGNLGGTLYVGANTAVLTNVTLTGNRSELFGVPAGIQAINNALVLLNNCIVYANMWNGSTTDPRATGLGSSGGLISAKNSIVANSGGSADWQLVSNSIFDQGGNLDVDPQFILPIAPLAAPSTSGLFQLPAGSPARNLGDNLADLDGAEIGTTVIGDTPFDVAGNPRIEAGTVDMGAHEGLGNPGLLPPYLIAPLPELELNRAQNHPGALDLSQLFDSSASNFQFVAASPATTTGSVGSSSGIVNINPDPVFSGPGWLEVSAANANGTSPLRIPILFFAVIRAAPGADPGNTLLGDTWANATNLRRGLLLATAGTNIWLQEGIYYPDEGEGAASNSAFARFEIDRDTIMLGGFVGTETDESQRDPATNLTVLSGDLTQNDVTDATGIVQEARPFNPNRTLFPPNAYTLLRVTADLKIDGLTVTAGHNQSGTTNGSAVDAPSQVASAIDATNCRFIGNASAGVGGGLYLNAVSAAFQDCEFRGNLNTGNQGGAVAIEDTSGDTRFLRCDFENNDAEFTGGAAYCKAFTSFEDCTFVDNSGRSGGAVRFSGADGSLVNCLIQGTVTDGSGAVAVIHADVRIESCRFIGNRANNNAGALDVGQTLPTTCTVVNCLFAGNTATSPNPALDGGGAIRVKDSDTTMVIVNSTIAGNFTRLLGGAVFNRDADLTLYNTILANNFSEDGIQSADHIISGTIASSFSHCLVEGSGGSGAWDSAFGVNLGSNLDGDPLFLDPRAPDFFGTITGDYHVIGWSPAVDSGDAGAPEVPGLLTDLDGSVRISAGGIDLGCYEDPAPLPKFGDLDADGMANCFEFEHTASPRSVVDLLPGDDLDGDKITNIAEFFHGFHPHLIDPTPITISTAGEPDGDLTVTLESIRHRDSIGVARSNVQFSPDLGATVPFSNLPSAPAVVPHPTLPNTDILTWTVPNVSLAEVFLRLRYRAEP